MPPITHKGEVFDFPDDATPEEIKQFIPDYAPAAPTPSRRELGEREMRRPAGLLTPEHETPFLDKLKSVATDPVALGTTAAGVLLPGVGGVAAKAIAPHAPKIASIVAGIAGKLVGRGFGATASRAAASGAGAAGAATALGEDPTEAAIKGAAYSLGGDSANKLINWGANLAVVPFIRAMDSTRLARILGEIVPEMKIKTRSDLVRSIWGSHAREAMAEFEERGIAEISKQLGNRRLALPVVNKILKRPMGKTSPSKPGIATKIVNTQGQPALALPPKAGRTTPTPASLKDAADVMTVLRKQGWRGGSPVETPKGLQARTDYNTLTEQLRSQLNKINPELAGRFNFVRGQMEKGEFFLNLFSKPGVLDDKGRIVAQKLVSEGRKAGATIDIVFRQDANKFWHTITRGVGKQEFLDVEGHMPGLGLSMWGLPGRTGMHLGLRFPKFPSQSGVGTPGITPGAISAGAAAVSALDEGE